MKEKYCWHYVISSNLLKYQKFLGTAVCGNWICTCGVDLKNHMMGGLGKSANVNCFGFKFDNNSRCDSECLFIFKIYQHSNKLINE